MNLYYSAEKYDLPEIKAALSEKLHQNLNEKNALETYEFMQQFQLEFELLEKIATFICTNTLAIIQDESFESIQRSTMNFLLSKSKINAMEIHLFEACIRWALAECHRNSIEDPTPQQLREALGKINIR